MADTIYGVDLTQPVTPLKVRDALRNCFYEAHESFLGFDASKVSTPEEFEKTKRQSIELFLRKICEDVGCDYDSPTKEGLIKVCNSLKDYSKNFRDPELIQKHYSSIMDLIGKLT